MWGKVLWAPQYVQGSAQEGLGIKPKKMYSLTQNSFNKESFLK